MRWLWTVLGALSAVALVVISLFVPGPVRDWLEKLTKGQIAVSIVVAVIIALPVFYAYMKWGADYQVILLRKTCPLILWFDDDLAMCPPSPRSPPDQPSTGTVSSLSGKTPLFVAGVSHETEQRVVPALQSRLRNAGFAVVGAAKEAEIKVEVQIDGVTNKIDPSTLVARNAATARLRLSAAWSADRAWLIRPEEVLGVGYGATNEALDVAVNNALSDAVNKVVDRFKALSAR